jgi:hypothetical protein
MQPNPLVTLPLDPDALKKWKGDIDLADKKRKVYEPSWERNLKNYAPDPTNTEWGNEINVGVDFYQTEQKKDQLFFDTPELVLTPEPDTDPSLAGAISQQQTKLNRKLGRKGLDCKRLMDKVNFDVICPAGMGCVKIGVTQISRDVPAPLPDAQGQPVLAPMPVLTRIFAERFSPKKILIPTNFYDTEYDKAPWLGMKFTMPTRAARRQFELPPDFEPKKTTTADEQVFPQQGVPTDADDEQVTGTAIFYHADLYDDAVYHPDWFRELVFIDGIDDPVVHRNCPYQTFDEQAGEFSPDSLLINPIQIVTVRDLADSAYVPSDCTVTRPLVNELNRFREQLVEHRDSSAALRFGNEKVMNPDVVAKWKKSPYGGLILIPETDYDPNRPPIMQAAPATMSRENFQGQDIIERDISKMNTLAANQTATEQDTVRSATELTYVQRNADVRMQAERNRILAAFLKIAAGIDTLMRRYETPAGQQPLTGYSYDIKPDSGMHVDAASDRKFALDRYNMLAKDPNVNRSYLLTELAPDLRLDASKLVIQPPPPHAEPPKTSLIVKGEDISPLAPQYQNMVEILNEIGVKVSAVAITPDLITNAALAKPLKPPTPTQPEHPGAPPQADKVNQHTEDNSGRIPHFGGQAGGIQ